MYKGDCTELGIMYTKKDRLDVNDDLSGVVKLEKIIEAILEYCFNCYCCYNYALNQYLEGAMLNAFRKCCRSTLVSMHCTSKDGAVYNCLTTDAEKQEDKNKDLENRLTVLENSRL